ncbi:MULTISPECIES: ATP-binding protein [Streptomyces]|uniref:ATP-binding protein n=2 Tax=Streptomyces TaxID=1883 RepID=UPI000A50EDA6|nr:MULTISPECIES: ATP-binding protein [unclassified Streptomyces]MYY18051.1 ATP-binding protein [Streptomyces sp. SID4912]
MPGTVGLNFLTIRNPAMRNTTALPSGTRSARPAPPGTVRAATDPARTGAEPALVHLPCRPQSASAARRFVREKLTEWGLSGLADDALLITSELVTNAAKTACRRPLSLGVERTGEGSVRISVTDGSRALPVRSLADEEASGGRNLALVHHLTGRRWPSRPRLTARRSTPSFS